MTVEEKREFLLQIYQTQLQFLARNFEINWGVLLFWLQRLEALWQISAKCNAAEVGFDMAWSLSTDPPFIPVKGNNTKNIGPGHTYKKAVQNWTIVLLTLRWHGPWTQSLILCCSCTDEFHQMVSFWFLPLWWNKWNLAALISGRQTGLQWTPLTFLVDHDEQVLSPSNSARWSPETQRHVLCRRFAPVLW